MIDIGIRSKTAPGDFTLEYLQFFHEAGFCLLEWNLNKAGLDHVDDTLAGAIGDYAGVHGTHFTAHAPDTMYLTSVDLDVVTVAVEQTKQVLCRAHQLGSRCVVLHACPCPSIMPGKQQQQVDHLVWALEALVETCEQYQLPLAIETMIPGRVTADLELLIAVIDKVDSPWIGICLDTNHVNIDYALDEAVEMAGERILEFHLNDNHGVKEEHLLPFAGRIDWESFAGTVRGIGFDGPMILEPNFPAEWSLQQRLCQAGPVVDRLAQLFRGD